MKEPHKPFYIPVYAASYFAHLGIITLCYFALWLKRAFKLLPRR